MRSGTYERDVILSASDLLIGFGSKMNIASLIPSLTTSAHKGELIALIGENGIGKSTLLRTLTGLQKRLSGTILIAGRELSDFNRYDLARRIGYVSTEPVRVSNMNVYELVSLGRYPYTSWTGKLGKEDHKAVSLAIEKTGMHRYSLRNIDELSDGERQRAMIARVLAQDADILVLDEPTAFLDIRGRYEIVRLLHDLSRSRNKTVIFSTHDLITALSEADRIWLMTSESFTDGLPSALVANGTINSLFDASVVDFSENDSSLVFRMKIKGE